VADGLFLVQSLPNCLDSYIKLATGSKEMIGPVGMVYYNNNIAALVAFIFISQIISAVIA
jgi:hypothetical protein